MRREESGQAARFEWDEQNRLRTAHAPDGATIRMAYDALGRRCRKSVDGRRTFFAWDGDALLAEQFEDQPAREYVYYPGTFEPLALIEADGQVYYYHNDPNGLPQELTRPNGEPVWSATYDAHGRITGLLEDQIAQPLRLQGQYFDPEVDLCYNRHRYFDPHICSFISQDPLGLAAGENVYAYAPNVWGWVDPLGLCRETNLSRKSGPPVKIDANGRWHDAKGRFTREQWSAFDPGVKNKLQGLFSSSDSAANAALIRYNDKSIRDNLEYGGLIYKTEHGRYDFTKAIRGNEDGVNPWVGKKIPKGSEEVGYWHTHGDYSKIDSSGKIARTDKAGDEFVSDHFSETDIEVAEEIAETKSEYRGYLGTPGKQSKGYDPNTKKEYDL